MLTVWNWQKSITHLSVVLQRHPIGPAPYVFHHQSSDFLRGITLRWVISVKVYSFFFIFALHHIIFIILTCSVPWYCTEQPWTSLSGVPCQHSQLYLFSVYPIGSHFLWCTHAGTLPSQDVCMSRSEGNKENSVHAISIIGGYILYF